MTSEKEVICYNQPMLKRVILLHGRKKTPTESWYPWFVKTCQEYGIECTAPRMPVEDPPVLKDWVKVINDLKPDANSILVGHSLGGMAILRWLEQAADDVRVSKVVLVAVPNPNVLVHGLSDFYGKDYDYAKIKKHCDTFIQFHSIDDDIVPFKAGELNIAGLGGELREYKGLEHFGNNLTRMRDIFETALDIKLPRPN